MCTDHSERQPLAVNDMILFTYVVGTLVVLFIVQYFFKRRKSKLVAHIRGPFTIPLLGGIHFAYGVTPQNLLQKATEAHAKYGKVLRLWIFHRLIIDLADPKIAEVLLTNQTNIRKHHLYNLLHPWLGVGLLLSDGQKWYTRRKIITPTFHFKILEEFVEVFDQQSAVLVQQMERHCDSGCEFDVYPFVCLAALDIIAETAMGTKIHAQTDSNNAYTRAVTEITEITFMRFLKIHLANETIFSILCPRIKRRQSECINTLHAFTTKVIEDRRAALQKTISQQSNGQTPIDDIGSKKRMALLDVLLQSTVEGKPLSNEDIREEVDTFMFEGHDTTTSAISFALVLIARHPKVQQKVFEEICETLGRDQTEPITHRALQELKYTECVIKESLRMYPPVPVIGRELTEDLVYDGGVLPAGAEVLIGVMSMSNDPEVFPEPEVFRPERHLLEERCTPFAFVPFSAGPRNCIGQKFAMLEMKCLITKVLRYFELLPLGQNVKPSMNILLRSDNGFQLGLKRRVY